MSALGPLSANVAPAGGASVTPAGARAAQAAFFRAALEGAAAPQRRPDAPPPSGAAPAQEAPPARAGRPGALLDIRV